MTANERSPAPQWTRILGTSLRFLWNFLTILWAFLWASIRILLTLASLTLYFVTNDRFHEPSGESYNDAIVIVDSGDESETQGGRSENVIHVVLDSDDDGDVINY